MKNIMIVGKDCSRFIIRDVLAEILSPGEAEIYEFQHPSEAIGLLHNDTHVDLVVTGYLFDNLIDGLQFSVMIRNLSPSTKIVMASTIEPPNLDIYLESKILDGFYLKDQSVFEVLKKLLIENLEGVMVDLLK